MLALAVAAATMLLGPAAQAASGTPLAVDVRGKTRTARVVTRPIYKREG